ncbi:MAG: DUF2934 domain-containing protein [Phycisphaerae bacterium]|nr:DUF2934 domain-containing protein [Phycisphaerae bacterium]
MARTPNNKAPTAPRSGAPATPSPAAVVAAAPATRPSSPATVEPKARPSREEIARAAYFRWLRHGGDSTSNWLAAEQELLRGVAR